MTWSNAFERLRELSLAEQDAGIARARRHLVVVPGGLLHLGEGRLRLVEVPLREVSWARKSSDS